MSHAVSHHRNDNIRSNAKAIIEVMVSNGNETFQIADRLGVNLQVVDKFMRENEMVTPRSRGTNTKPETPKQSTELVLAIRTLRRRGVVVYNASVMGKDPAYYYVDQKMVHGTEIPDLAWS